MLLLGVLCLQLTSAYQPISVPTENLPPEVAIQPEIERLLLRGEELIYSQPEESRELLHRAEKLADELNDRSLSAEVYQHLAIFYWARGDFEKGLTYDRKSIRLLESLGNQSDLAYSLNGLAVSLMEMGLKHEALKNLIEAEDILIEQKDSTGLQMVYLNLGVLFDNMKDYDVSMDYYVRALNIGLSLELYREVGDVYNNMAENRMIFGEYDEAFELYGKAFKIYKNENDAIGIALIKGNLANYYKVIGNYDVSETLYFESLRGYEEMEDLHGRAEIMLGIGQLYSDIGQYEKSEFYLSSVVDICKTNGYINMLIDAKRSLAKLMYLQKDFDQAYGHFEDYDRVRDSLYLASRTREFDNLRMAYESEEKERQLEALRSERQKEQIISDQQERLSNALITIVILLLLFSAFGLMLYVRLRRAKTKLENQQRVLEEKNHEVAETANKLKVANKRLMNEKKLAEISSEAKAEFVSVLSHEIRTPLNAIVGIAHLLKEEFEQSEQSEYIEALAHSAQNLLGFTNNILDLSKIDAGKIELSREKIDLDVLLTQILRTFGATVKEKNLFLNHNVDKDVPTRIVGDKMRLTQILLNLISNAVKYTHHGGVNVDIQCDGWDKNGVWIKFLVMDSGSGIEESLKSIIFDRYSRLQFESTLTPQGSGLGLSITKSLVELMGGSIEFESQEGVGSTFWVRLRFQPWVDASKPEKIDHENQTEAAESPITNKRVLLVEDNPVNIMFTTKLLENVGMLVSVANNGQEAVEKACESDYDLILMDLQMPVLNGMDATELILKDKPKSIVVALTANADHRLKSKLLKAGFKDLLIKPFKPEEISQRIQNWLSE